MDSKKVIADLTLATGWKDIHYTKKEDESEGTFVFSFPVTDFRFIKGLRSSGVDKSIFLDFPSFNDLNLSFLVYQPHDHNDITQYWTRNRRMHRTNDQPAFVRHRVGGDIEGTQVVREWYWWGLIHREDGPARETYRDYRCIYPDDTPYHYSVGWSNLKLEWMYSGISQHYPSPASAMLGDGSYTKKRATNLCDDCSGTPGLQAEEIIIEWCPPYEADHMQDQLIPYSLEAQNLSESYNNGKLTNRSMDDVKMDWCHRGKILNATGNLKHFNQALSEKDFFTNLDLWKAPFYPRAGAEFMALTEFQRTKASEPDNE
jgi:hypothetical protein